MSVLKRMRDLAAGKITGEIKVFEYGFAADRIQELERQLAARDAEIAELRKDSVRIDHMETQCTAYGFQDIHEGNRWSIEGPFATLRMAIDADIAIARQGEKHDNE